VVNCCEIWLDVNETVNSEIRTINIDSTPPQISNFGEFPADPATWAFPQDYYFNATITDNIDIGDVGAEFNGTNNTGISKVGTTYTFHVYDLDSGTYNYYWFANDTAGNRNVSEVFTYTVNKAAGQVQLALNDTQANLTGTTETNVKVTGSTLYGDLNITRDGIDVNNETGIYVKLSAGSYNYTACSTGDTNHESACIERYADISTFGETIPPWFTNIPDNKAIDFGVNFIDDFNATDDYSFDSFAINQTDLFTIDSSSGEISNLSSLQAQIYNINVTINDSFNNINSTIYQLTVNQASGNVTTYLNQSAQNITLTEGDSIILNGTLHTGEFGSLNLTQDGVQLNYSESIDITSNQTFSTAGSYNITTVYSGDTNYTGDVSTFFVDVQVGPDEIPPYFTNIPDPLTVDFGENILDNFNATDDIELDSFASNSSLFTISQSGETANITNSTMFSAGTYYVNVSITDTNSNVNSTIWQVTVNPITPIDGSISGDGTYEYPYESTITGSETNNFDGDVTYTLYRDSVAVSNPETTTLGVGTYEYLFNATAGTNYTDNSSMATGTLEITQNDSYVISLDITPSQSETYPTETTATGSNCPSGVSCVLYLDGAEVSNPDTQTLGVGTYIYNYTFSGNTNYTAKNISKTLTITQGTGEVALYLNNSRADTGLVEGNTLLINGTLLTGEFGTLNLTIDGVQQNFTTNHLLNDYNFTTAGFYNVSLSYSGNTNYTADAEEWFVNVTEGADTIPPWFTNIPNTKNVNFGENVLDDFNATDDVLFDSFVVNQTDLFSIDASTGQIENITSLQAQSYYINVTINDTSNNINSTIWQVNVNQIASEVVLYLNDSRQNLTLTEGESTIINATLLTGQFGNINLTKDGVQINYTSDNILNSQTFSTAGSYNFTATYTGNTNYTGDVEEWFVDVQVGPDEIPPYFTDIPDNKAIAFGAEFIDDFNATDDIELDSFVVNQTDLFTIGQSTGIIQNISSLQAGIYNINVTINDTSNNVNSTIYQLTVNQGSGSVTLLLNNTDDDISLSYPGQVNASATGSGTVELLRDGTDVTAQNGLFQNLAVGYYNFTANVPATVNTTSATITHFANITKGTVTLSLDFNPSNSETYPTETTVTGSGCVAQLSCNLFECP